MEPFKVRAAVNWERSLLLGVSMAWPFFSLLIYLATRNDLLAVVPISLIFLPFLIAPRKRKLLQKRSAEMSDEGISALEEDQILWSLPWSRYGNFHMIKLPLLAQVFHPERMGVELLDKAGVVVGMLNLEPGGANQSNADNYEQQFLRRRFFHELERRALDSEERAKAVRLYSTTPGKVRKEFLLSTVCLGLGLVMLFGLGEIIRNGFSGETWQVYAVSGWALLLCLLSMFVGLMFFFRANFGRFWLKRPYEVELGARRWDQRDEVRFRNLSRKGTEPGKRYRYFIDLRPSPDSTLISGAGFIVLAVMVLSALATLPFGMWLELMSGFAVTGVVVAPLAYLARRDSFKTRLAKDDTIVRMEDGLVVLRSDGSNLSFGPEAIRKHEVLAQTRPGYESWREGKRKYSISLRDLVEIEEPDEAVKAELAELLIAKDSLGND